MSDNAPSIKVCRLYEKKSAKGATYFVGRWGAARIAVLKDKQAADDGTPIWNVLLSEAPAVRQQADGDTDRPTSEVLRDY